MRYPSSVLLLALLACDGTARPTEACCTEPNFHRVEVHATVTSENGGQVSNLRVRPLVGRLPCTNMYELHPSVSRTDSVGQFARHVTGPADSACIRFVAVGADSLEKALVPDIRVRNRLAPWDTIVVTLRLPP